MSALLVLSLCWGGRLQRAPAGIIGTPDVMQAEQVVAPAQAQAGVDALSDDEAQWMAQRIDSAPAGASDLVGTVVFVFVLLLITDILGLTKVFPFPRALR